MPLCQVCDNAGATVCLRCHASAVDGLEQEVRGLRADNERLKVERDQLRQALARYEAQVAEVMADLNATRATAARRRRYLKRALEDRRRLQRERDDLAADYTAAIVDDYRTG